MDDRTRRAVPGPGLMDAAAGFWRERGFTGEEPVLVPLTGDGSTRRFFRLKSRRGSRPSFVIMWNPPLNHRVFGENLAYDRIGRHLRSRGVPVPRIYRADHEQGLVIMEDLGDDSLQSCTRRTKDPAPLFERVLEVLLHLQVEGSKGFDMRWCCQTPRYDRTVMILLEACYFREAFLRRYAGVKGDMSRLDRCFTHCAEAASMAPGGFFLHRDFQSRNVMVSGGEIRVIDWQGGRLGPAGYDPASLAIDPYIEAPEGFRSSLVETYALMLRERATAAADFFLKTYRYLALQRNMQILGAFAYLSLEMGKKEFESYIVPAFGRMKATLEELSDPALVPLAEIVDGIEPCPGSPKLSTSRGRRVEKRI